MRPARWLWKGAGLASLSLGIVGIALPLLPTVPFVLLAAFCFSKGSPALERWILEHSRFGPMIASWRETRTVPRRAVLAAAAMMLVSCGVSSLFLPMPWLLAPWTACAAVGAWLWSRRAD